MIATLTRLAAWLGAAALGSAAALCMLACLSWSLSLHSWLLSAGLALIALGLARSPRRDPATGRSGAWLLWAGLALSLGPPALRAVFVRGDARVALRLYPEGSAPRLVDRLFPESDGSLLAAGWLSLTRALRDEEAARFHAIMREAYARLSPDAASVPTPAIATYLGLQTSSAFDTIVIQPAQGAPRGALIFLHGYAGNFYVYCWEIAQAASQAGLLTVCPSVSARGAWWNADGEHTFRATLQALRVQGIQRVFLGGLSNGGAGASAIAQRHARELAGLVLISGVGAGRLPAIPTLIIQGSRDRMMPAPRARATARQGRHIRYHELPGGHLIFLSQHEHVRPLITTFLRNLNPTH